MTTAVPRATCLLIAAAFGITYGGPQLASPVGSDWKMRFQANFLFPR